MAGDTDHSVWAVYDLLRTARLNVKYYSGRIGELKQRQFWLDFVLAIVAPSSAVAGLWFWEYPLGEIAWKVLAVLAAVIAVVKPLLKYGDKIQTMEEVLAGYKALDHDLYCITLEIQRKKAYTDDLQQTFREALARKGVLVGRVIEHWEDTKLKRQCEQEVCEELPAAAFYVPGEEHE
jgi:hypothetical protein